MFDPSVPDALAALETGTLELGFDMPSDRATGALLRFLVACRPSCRILEIGVGTGLGAAWLLDSPDDSLRYLGIDNDPAPLAVAREGLAGDSRVELVLCDGDELIPELVRERRRFDVIFADSWPGKYRLLDEALELLDDGGVFVIDDMLPQPNWPEGHEEKAAVLLREISGRTDLVAVPLDWSTGIVLITRPSS